MQLKSRIFRVCFVLCLVISFSIIAFADTIRLKDGSLIKGKIVSFGNGTFVVMIDDGTRQRQMTFRADEVESIKFDSEPSTANMVRTSDPIKTEPPTIIKENNSTIITAGQSNKGTLPPPAVSNEEVIDQTEDTDASKTTGVDPIPASIKPIEISIKVLADNTSNGWTNSGWVVRKGQKIRITGAGRISLGNGRFSSPSGIISLPDSDKLVKDQATGGLIAVIGDDNNDFIFIGADREFVAKRDGALFLGVNEGNLNDNSGVFDVKIEVSPADK